MDNYFKALLLNPDKANLNYNLARAYSSLGKLHEAKEYYEKAVMLDENYVKAYSDLGLVYSRLDERKNAFVMQMKVLELSPEYEKAKKNLRLLSVNEQIAVITKMKRPVPEAVCLHVMK